MRSPAFLLAALAAGALVFAACRLVHNDYVFFAGYIVLQYIVLATAWNILGGYCGYVNFGTAAFFGLGAYSTVAIHKLLPLPLPVLIAAGGIVSGVVGLGTGYLTLRLRGAFFSIATLALAVVVQTLITNWDFVGGSRGAYIVRPATIPLLGSYIQYLFIAMLVLAVVALTAARAVERSRLGYGFAAIRDDELAAETSGVPTLRLKLVATTLSGAFMGMAGAPFPYYVGYLDPASAFNLAYAVNSIAMPLIGGTTSWIGPLIGAVLLGSIQQVATVTISSAVNLLIVGALLVAFVIIAPIGIVGLMREFLRSAAPARLDIRAVSIISVATYCLIAGILAIVFGLSAVITPERAGTGVVILAASVLYLASAYGLLKLRGWSHLLATAALAISIPVPAVLLWLDLSNEGRASSAVENAVVIAVALVAVAYLQTRRVRKLLRPAKEGETS
jgi:branched-chain amino acid transport system permease protein